MKHFVFLFPLLAALNLYDLTAGEPSRPSTTDDVKKANQIREEKIEKSLVSLAVRCQKMLDAQVALYDRTKRLHKVVQSNDDKKPRPKDKAVSVELAGMQKAIIADAMKAIAMLKADGTAAAFPEVFEQVRDDMKRVERKLKMGDVGAATQAIEDDIIETLNEMVRALKTSR